MSAVLPSSPRSALLPLVVGVVVLVTGCGTMVVDGITVIKDDYERDREQILRQATIDLACPQPSLSTQVLRVDVHADVIRLAVRGCGKDVVYAPNGEGGFAIETSTPPVEP